MTPTLSRIAVGLMLFIGMAGSTVANNVQVTNVELIGQNTTAGADHPANFTMIQFDVDWENSWRASVPSSWDAAWIFAKFRVGSADYLSAPGATNSGTTVTVQSTEGLRTGMPVFVHSGSGSFAAGTVITGITSTTTFTISATPTGNLGGSAVVRAERIWEHCWLHQSGHVKGSMGNSGSLQVGLQDESAAFHASNNPALGVYIYRAADGSGAFSTAGARLRWNYGAQGIKDKDLVELKVFAVEMVYVPQGSFQVDTALYQSNTVLLLDGDGSNGQKNKPIIDASGNNHTITVNNIVYQGSVSPFCNQGGSAFFPGGGTAPITTSNSIWTNLNGTNTSFTVEAWVYPTAISTMSYGVIGSHIIGNHTSGSGPSGMFQITPSRQLYFGSWDQGSFTGTFSSSNAVPLNSWSHVAASKSGNQMRLFVNGNLVGTKTITSASFPNLPTYIGGRAGGSDFPFYGYMSNVRVVHGTALYTANFTPPTGPLTAVSGTALLLKFEDGALDDSQRRHNLETVGNAQISTVESKFGGASMAFGGVSGARVTAPSTIDFAFGTSDFTLEYWLYLNSASGTQVQLDFRTTTNQAVPTIYSSGTGLRYFVSGADRITGGVLSPGQWYHITLCRSGNDHRLFIDGNQIGATWVSATNYVQNSIHIGNRWDGGFPVNGYIDDLRITKGVARYTANFTPPNAPFPSVPPVVGYTISSENQLTLGGTAAGNLQYPVPGTAVADDFNASTTQILPAAFPKGYDGFYVMKYEVSQERWIDFFNTLSSLQKPALDITAANGKSSDAITFRNNISWTTGDATLNGGTHGNVACNYLSWVDAMAYTDWIGMRPMTELEYEKAARGQGSVRLGEGTSGRTCITLPKLIAVLGISNSGAANELPANSSANAIFDNRTAGPLRTGLLATATSSREASGAGFWGAMELGGNVSEQVVTMGNSTGRSFTGAHGNGQLTALGYADVSTWPGYVTSAVTGATGSGKRGGSWEDIGDRLRISDRMEANSAVTARDRKTGYRAVRTLPVTPAQ